MLLVALDEGCLLSLKQLVHLRLQVVCEVVQLRERRYNLQKGILQLMPNIHGRS